MSNEIDEKLFEQIFRRTLIELTDKLINTQNYWSLYVNNFFFFFVYKMFNITKKTLENDGIEVIVNSVNALWLNENNIEKN